MDLLGKETGENEDDEDFIDHTEQKIQQALGRNLYQHSVHDDDEEEEDSEPDQSIYAKI